MFSTKFNHHSTLLKSAICLMLGLMLSNINMFGQMPAHYPTIELTGDAAIDDANWIKAKSEWIKNYPAEYQSVGGKIDVVSNGADTQVVVAEPANTTKIDFSDSRLYKLVKIDVVDIDAKHSSADMAIYRNEALSDFNNYTIAVDLANGIWYQKANNRDDVEWSKKINVTQGVISYADCKDCQDKYEIIEQTTSKLVLQVKPQDEGKFFVYQLEFSK
jgi:hypothetical protein